jgi:hypothetical protein
MKKITLLITILFSSIFGFTQNIVTNGDFSSGTTNWTTYLADFAGVSATTNTTNQEANFTSIVLAGAPQTWHIQLFQSLTPTQISSLTVGQNYKITFKARGASARPLKLFFGEDGGGFVAIHQQDYNLTTTMATYEATFNVGQTFAAMKLGFEAGLSNANFFIDDVTLELVSAPPATLDLLQDFQVGGLDSTFGGAIATLAANPSGAGQVLMLSQNNAGNVWQGVNINLLQNVQLTTNKTMTMEVYSTTPITIAPKVIAGLAGALDSTTSASHTGSGWETLSFTFNQGLDGSTTANGVYNRFVIYYNWNSGTNNFGTPDGRVFYVDNIRGTAVPIVPDPTPSTPAPVPTFPNSQVYSIYNDTNGYTTNFPVAYDFGFLSGEPDLDASATVNKAYKFNFGVAGWGQGQAMANVTSYGFVSFDYWAQPGLPNGFRFVMISNNGSVTEHVYQIGTNETLVTGQWKKVEIPMSFFTGIGFAATNFFQWKVSPFNDSVDNAGFVYVDNILLTVNSVLSNNSYNISKAMLYPNPTSNVLNIESVGNIQTIAIYNVLGQEVMNRETNGTSVSLDVSGLNAGIYVVKTMIDGNVSSTKFIKE